ncbi:MAG TPA: DHH family phosphoesterase [Methanobacterium sp.]|nr:DHH family phosphoesterase [Methanobacterium sp.]
MSKSSKSGANQHHLITRANEANKLLKEHLEQDHVVRVISHNDADGISAAGVICNAITCEKGKFHVTIVPRLKEEVLDKIFQEKYEIFFFCDMGSAWTQKIGKLKGDAIIADHHQTIDSTEDQETVVHVNPHLFGMDGTRDVSGSGVTYLTVRPMGHYELTALAMVGAFGDMQGNGDITGINHTIMQEGIKKNVIEVKNGLKASFLSEEPLYKALSYTFLPPLPDISGDFDGSKTFLEKIGVSYETKFPDLSNEEKDVLKTALVKLNPEIFGKIYQIKDEIPLLTNISDYSQIIDACGKSKKYGYGLSICLGDRKESLQQGMNFLNNYQNTVLKGVKWIKKEGSVEMDYIQYIYTENKDIKGFMGTLANIGLDLKLFNPDKPVLAMSLMDPLLKISGRTTLLNTEKGVNLGQALEQASHSYGGTGGGHTVAAGAVVPRNNQDNFLNLVDDIIKSQIEDEESNKSKQITFS